MPRKASVLEPTTGNVEGPSVERYLPEPDGLDIREGDSVHYVLPTSSRSPGEHRPARVVKVWNQETGSVNLVVDVDGSNDGYLDPIGHYGVPCIWVTSVVPNPAAEPGTWHYPEG